MESASRAQEWNQIARFGSSWLLNVLKITWDSRNACHRRCLSSRTAASGAVRRVFGDSRVVASIPPPWDMLLASPPTPRHLVCLGYDLVQHVSIILYYIMPFA